MTCEEFRIALYIPAWQSTRAERAAAIAHFDNCAECLALWRRLQALHPTTKEQAAAARKMTQEDRLDPEYREVVGR